MVVLRTAASAAPPKSMNCRPSPRLSLSSAATKCWLSEASGETSVRREQRQSYETEHLRKEGESRVRHWTTCSSVTQAKKKRLLDDVTFEYFDL